MKIFSYNFIDKEVLIFLIFFIVKPNFIKFECSTNFNI